MHTLLRALIVDSEAPARELLQDMLAPHRNVRVVGEANSAPTALSLYEGLQPNLVFMDVEMPKGDGFALLPARRRLVFLRQTGNHALGPHAAKTVLSARRTVADHPPSGR